LADPLIPSWLADDHPFYVSSPTAERVRRGFRPNRIFLNIPYASRYSNLEVAVLSTATAYDLDPCMAKERSKLEIRMRKIVELVLTCKYGFTDLSYATRMNMPFELGVLLAWGKETFVIIYAPSRGSHPGAGRREPQPAAVGRLFLRTLGAGLFRALTAYQPVGMVEIR
jgi:hypothetical protein